MGKLLALMGAVAVAAVACSTGGARPADEATAEPVHAVPATEAREFANGTTATGRPWSAVTYTTRGGYPCVDVVLSAAGSGGGCFAPEAGDRQWGWVDVPGAPGEFVAFGQFRDVPDGAAVDVAFAGGRRSVPVGEGGLFAVAGVGEPASVTPAG